MSEMRATRAALMDYTVNPTLPTCSFCGIFHPNHDEECPITPEVWAEVEAMEAVAAQLRNVLSRTPDRPYCKGGLTTCEDCRGSCGIEDAPDALARLDALGEQT